MRATVSQVLSHYSGPSRTMRCNCSPMVFVHTLRVRRSLMSLCTIRRTPEVELVPAATVLLVARAFKLEDGHSGQLTYQGSLKKGLVHFSTGARKENQCSRVGGRVYASFSSELTFVTLSQVKALDSIIIVDKVDYFIVQKLGRKHIQYFLIIMHVCMITLRSRPLTVISRDVRHISRSCHFPSVFVSSRSTEG